MKQFQITILLTLIMSMFGAKAFAHDIEVANKDGVTIYYNWINNNTELAVSFRGSNYSSYSNEYSGDVVIPESVDYEGKTYSVTSIGNLAFESCSGITSVTIPNSVTSIDGSAFWGCSSLASVIIPSSVTSIGDNAFGDCIGLSSVTIPNSVISIGGLAFNGCSGLTSVTIPNSVTSIGNSAFNGCSGLTSVTISNSVTSIGSYVFCGCSGLTSVSIPNSVTSIGNEAFSDCSSLTSVTIPNSVISISNNAFENCSALTIIKIPVTDLSAFCNNNKAYMFNYITHRPIMLIDNEGNEITSYNIPEDVTSIGSYTFYSCSGLNSVTIPNSVTSIGDEAFYSCNGLNSVTIPNSVTSIGDWAFDRCSGLTSVLVQCSPTTIGSSSFSECPNLKEVTFDCETVTSLFSGYTSVEKVTMKESVTSIEGYAFNGCSGLTSVTIPNSVTSIGNSAFYGCSGMTSVAIPNSVTSIGNEAFYNCTGLTSVTIPNSVTSIGQSAFQNCKGLTSITIGNGLISIGDYAFSGCSSLTSVTIPNSVTSIGYSAFQECSALTSVVIGSGVTSIGYDAFRNTNLKKTIWLTNTPPDGASHALGAINYVANEEYNISNRVVYPFLSSYFDVDGIRYVPISLSDKTCDAIDCILDESVANANIGPTVEYKGITMTVLNVQPYIGYNNQFVKSLNVNTKGTFGECAFYGCSNITNISLGSNLTSIESHAFAECSSLEEIKIKPMMTDIKDYAFFNCSSLKKVIIEDSNTELNLGVKLFDSCPLDTVYIGRNINYSTDQYAGYSPFYRNTSLRAVKITDKETEISENEFYGCTNLQRVIIGDGVTTIGNWAFSGCQSLKFFTFGSEVKTIGQEAFSDCSAVTEITSRAIAPPTCGSQALDDINKWECKLYVPKGHLADYQAAEQWKEFLFAEEGDYTIATKYTLTYTVDGEVYKTSQVAEGDAITPEPAPTKEGYIFSGWSTIPATMPANDVTITGTFSLPATEDVIKITSAGQTTWCSAYDLDFTDIEGIKAYTAGGYDRVLGTIWLMRVNQVPANEGILIMGTPGEYHVPHKSTGTYYANLMVGTIQPITIYETDGDYTNYYLSSGDSGVGFYKVNGSVDLKANRAYLPLLKGTTQAGTRFIGIVFGDDGTTNLTPTLSKGERDGEWYTLQGQRVAKPGKGIYIRKGKKIVIK